MPPGGIPCLVKILFSLPAFGWPLKKKKKKPALEQRSARGVWPKCKAAGQFAGRHCFSREGAERGAFQHLFRHFFKRWFKFEAMGPNAEPLTPRQDLMNHTLDRHCSPPATSLGGHGGVVFCFSCPHKNSFSSTDHVLVSGGQGTSLYLWHGQGIQQSLRTQALASSPWVWVAQGKDSGVPERLNWVPHPYTAWLHNLWSPQPDALNSVASSFATT